MELKKNKEKIFKGVKVACFILIPIVLLFLMILVLNYNTKIWYNLRLKPILFSLFLIELLYLFLSGILR